MIGPSQTPPDVYGVTPLEKPCPSCKVDVTSRVSRFPSFTAWLAGIGIFFVGGWCGCCLIPCYLEEFMVYTHTCPNCGGYLGQHGGAASCVDR